MSKTEEPCGWQIRLGREAELDDLTALCIRSKAYWGYDAAFMAACREEMTLRPSDLVDARLGVAVKDGTAGGMAQVGLEGEIADLDRLYVDPAFMGKGLGRALFRWAIEQAGLQGARAMTIEADPSASPFYQHMGAVLVGTAPSGSIPGRALPLLRYEIAR